MLTPEVTGQLRSLLNKGVDASAVGGGVADPLSDLLPPVSSWDKPGDFGTSETSAPSLPNFEPIILLKSLSFPGLSDQY